MFSYFRRAKVKIIFVLLTFLLFLLLFTQLFFSPDRQFQTFTQELFKQELSGSTLNLHYTLANPQKYGISSDSVTLGKVSLPKVSSACHIYKLYEEELLNFPSDELNEENRLTKDLLLTYFHTEQELSDFAILQEPLSPSLGIQAQLPVLLAEYTFRTKQDIVDYLKLLTCVRPYFKSIIAFEQEKAKQEVFMSDTSVDRILEQCCSFVADPEHNYLIEIFQEKINNFPDLTDQERTACIRKQKEFLLQSVIPSYQMLMQELSNLRGNGHNANGLFWYKNGTNYYEYLLKSQVGTFDPPSQIEQRLYEQFLNDGKEIRSILKKRPDLLDEAEPAFSENFSTAEDMLSYLSTFIKKDFPPLPSIDYELKYVHKSMEEFLSPAFYLTPPIDTGTPNTIYINQHSTLKGLELFTTLSHEGFPGHLYQTQYFRLSKPLPIRQLLGYSGYIEGWATYIESYTYANAPIDADYARLSWLNRSLNLCLYSLLDLGIHEHGWTLSMTQNYLKSFGITNPNTSQEIFQYIVENPANYLKYYWGYLNFVDIQKMVKEEKENNFSLSDFHKEILEIGPVPFPILKKYIMQE